MRALGGLCGSGACCWCVLLVRKRSASLHAGEIPGATENRCLLGRKDWLRAMGGKEQGARSAPDARQQALGSGLVAAFWRALRRQGMRSCLLIASVQCLAEEGRPAKVVSRGWVACTSVKGCGCRASRARGDGFAAQDEKQTTFAITADMTRQYKSMQEELMRRINTLETTIMEQKDQLDLARQVPLRASASLPLVHPPKAYRAPHPTAGRLSACSLRDKEGCAGTAVRWASLGAREWPAGGLAALEACVRAV